MHKIQLQARIERTPCKRSHCKGSASAEPLYRKTPYLPMEILEKIELMEKIARAFSPSAPIDVRSFAGRASQMNDVINACVQRGQHVVLFGERGAGKTSLVNALAHSLRAKFVMPE